MFKEHVIRSFKWKDCINYKRIILFHKYQHILRMRPNEIHKLVINLNVPIRQPK